MLFALPIARLTSLWRAGSATEAENCQGDGTIFISSRPSPAFPFVLGRGQRAPYTLQRRKWDQEAERWI